MGAVVNIEVHLDQSDEVELRCDGAIANRIRRDCSGSVPDPNRELRWVVPLIAMAAVLVCLPFLLLHGGVDG
ncbi:hypothetical protein [Rhodococcus sp. NCIMB 12038]|uniref:hypothetical protein n=1 Tax=Rhodococcus sp. NCIMB 12038 TaxID=933800 RepID=UPI000B3C03DF|nr:hypothetical protein [Rhodococcus sp. NCIMB 12038]OUS97358.1 hypothetical protein CA951_03150 [Rhodococcus sp. NCIMB 12038]